MWSLLWGAIGTGPWSITSSGSGTSGIINYLRALGPIFVIAIMTVILPIARRERNLSSVEVGLWGYGIISLISAIMFDLRFNQIYWALAYLGALSVGSLALRGRHPIDSIVKLNVLSWVSASVFLLVMFVFARELLFADNATSGYGIVNKYQRETGVLISRSSGFSRLAAIPAIISISYILNGRNKTLRLISIGIFVFSVFIIWFMQSRGSLVAFTFALLFIILSGRTLGKKIVTLILIGSGIIVLLLSGASGDLWDHASRSEGVEGFYTMTGRTDLWAAGWQHVLERPFFGYGPQADRFLVGQNASSALIYALLSAGIIGGILYFYSFFVCIKKLFFVTKFLGKLEVSDRNIVSISGGILIFSLFRSIPENQATVFSIDLLLQLPAMLIIIAYSRQIRRTLSFKN